MVGCHESSLDPASWHRRLCSPEALRHDVTGVREAEEHERHAHDRVGNGQELARCGLGRLVAVADGGDADDGIK